MGKLFAASGGDGADDAVGQLVRHEFDFSRSGGTVARYTDGMKKIRTDPDMNRVYIPAIRPGFAIDTVPKSMGEEDISG